MKVNRHVYEMANLEEATKEELVKEVKYYRTLGWIAGIFFVPTLIMGCIVFLSVICTMLTTSWTFHPAAAASIPLWAIVLFLLLAVYLFALILPNELLFLDALQYYVCKRMKLEIKGEEVDADVVP